MVMLRELTKRYETVVRGEVAEIVQLLHDDPNQSRGEIVLILEGAGEKQQDDSESDRILQLLIEDLGIKKAAAMTSKITGEKKNAIYQRALERSRTEGRE